MFKLLGKYTLNYKIYFNKLSFCLFLTTTGFIVIKILNLVISSVVIIKLDVRNFIRTFIKKPKKWKIVSRKDFILKLMKFKFSMLIYVLFGKTHCSCLIKLKKNVL